MRAEAGQARRRASPCRRHAAPRSSPRTCPEPAKPWSLARFQGPRLNVSLLTSRRHSEAVTRVCDREALLSRTRRERRAPADAGRMCGRGRDRAAQPGGAASQRAGLSFGSDFFDAEDQVATYTKSLSQTYVSVEPPEGPEAPREQGPAIPQAHGLTAQRLTPQPPAAQPGPSASSPALTALPGQTETWTGDPQTMLTGPFCHVNDVSTKSLGQRGEDSVHS